jgi:hypothetical protein
MEDMNNGGKKMTCNCVHHKIVPWCIVLIGLAALLGQLGWLSVMTVGVVWPVLLIVIGLVKVFSQKCGCCMGK